MQPETSRTTARTLLARGATAEALATLEAEADRVADADPAGAATLLVEAAQVALAVSGPDRAVATTERAVALTSAVGGVHFQQAMIRLGDALSWAGRYDDARRAWLTVSVERAEAAPGLLAERANALLRLGDEAAHDAAYRALVAARSVGELDLVLDALNLVTIAEVRAGRLKEALRAVEDGMALVEGAGTIDEVDVLGALGWVLALLGDERRCRDVIERAQRGLAERRVTAAPGGHALGMLALSLGAAAEATAAFEAKLEELHWGPVAAMTGLRPFGAELVEAYSRSGRIEQGRRVLAATLPVALGSGQPRLIAPMRRAQGILEDDEDAFQHALDAHAGWANRFEEARTRLAFGELLRRRRKRAESRAELEIAVAGFAHVGAVLWRQRAIAELRLAGERLPARGALADAAVPEPLTRQEGEVIDLVRIGLSNRAIAERLVLSVKTVEGHLTTIYGKLGVASRAGALAVLAGQAPDVSERGR
jgi:ATP/maltotriose-dependent transcriptional regulator MalT